MRSMSPPGSVKPLILGGTVRGAGNAEVRQTAVQPNQTRDIYALAVRAVMNGFMGGVFAASLTMIHIR